MENRPGCSRFAKSRDACRPVSKHDNETKNYIYILIFNHVFRDMVSLKELILVSIHHHSIKCRTGMKFSTEKIY